MRNLHKCGHTTEMLHALLVDMKLNKLADYRHVETSKIECACSEIEVAQLQDILTKLLVDIGMAVDNAEKLVCFRITMGRLLNRGRESHSTRPHRLQLYQGRMTVKGRMERCLGEITERYVLQKAL